MVNKNKKMTDKEIIDIIKNKYNIYFLEYRSLRDIYYDFDKKESAYFLNGDDEIEGIKIKGYNLKEIPQELKDLKYLRVLSMPDNQIESIKIVNNLPELAALKLTFNNIKSIEGIENHKNLKWLDLKFNKIEDLTPISSVEQLQKLYLDNNLISSIEAIANLKNIIHLSISKNKLSDVCALNSLTNLKNLDLSSNQISKIDCLTKLKNLEKLDVSNNQISNIPEQFQKLKEFKAENNQFSKTLQSAELKIINEIENELKIHFSQVHSAEQLYLNTSDKEAAYSLNALNQVEGLKIKGYGIKNIPKKIAEFKNLSILRLPDNKIETTSDVQMDIKTLTFLDVANNRIKNCSFLSNLKNIKHLDISQNHISDITPICNLSKLLQLNIADNQVTNIDCLKDLSNLTRLNITKNKIGKIPDFKQKVEIIKEKQIGTFAESPDLQIIKKLENQLHINFVKTDKKQIFIPTADKEAKFSLNQKNQVTALKLTGYGLKSVPEELKNLKNCEIINLQSNQLKTVDFLHELDKILMLDLSNNFIESTKFLKNLTSLKQLNLNNNKINDISHIAKLKNIEKLSFDNNLIKDFEVISNLRKLKEISLINNRIEKIPDANKLINCTKLQKIWLDGNRINAISQDYPNIDISLRNNPIESLYFFSEPQKGVLDVDNLGTAVSNLIEHLGASKQGMFGLFGRWGRGKTFFWQILKAKLIEKDYKTIEFSAWKYNETPAIWAYLYETFINGLYEKMPLKKRIDIIKKNFVRNTFQAIFNTLLFIVVPILIFLFFNKDINKALNFVTGNNNYFLAFPALATYFIFFILIYIKISELKLPNLIKQITKRKFTDILGIQAEIEKDLAFFIKNYNKKIVLFIDDLDRCDEQKILQLIDSLRIIIENPQIHKKLTIIAAIDERILKQVVRNKYAAIINDQNDEMLATLQKEYIEKLFIFAIKLPKLSENQKNEILLNFIEETVDKKIIGVTDDAKKYLTEFMKNIDDITPRQIRNLYNKFVFANALLKQKLSGNSSYMNYKKLIAALIVYFSFRNTEDDKKIIDFNKICKITDDEKLICTIFDNEFVVSKKDYGIIVDVIKTTIAF
jgi:Leucine-rich repeat (LRR) protein